MSDSIIHAIIIGLLLAILFVTLFYGCRCRMMPAKATAGKEGFEAGAGASANDGLTAKERELFQNLITDKLSEKDIMDMVKNNVLTDKLVEKFLTKLTNEGASDSGDKVVASTTAKNAEEEAAKDKIKIDVEAFCPGPNGRNSVAAYASAV